LKTAEERARQVAAVQEQRKRRWSYKRRELRPRTLLRAMGQQERLSPEWLRDIMEGRYTNPVVSLYLTMTAGSALRTRPTHTFATALIAAFLPQGRVSYQNCAFRRFTESVRTSVAREGQPAASPCPDRNPRSARS